MAVPTINEGDNEEEEFVNLGKGNKPYTLFYTLLQKKFNVAGIPRYYMKYFVILHENREKNTNYFVEYHELFRVFSRKPRYTSFPF